MLRVFSRMMRIFSRVIGIFRVVVDLYSMLPLKYGIYRISLIVKLADAILIY